MCVMSVGIQSQECCLMGTWKTQLSCMNWEGLLVCVPIVISVVFTDGSKWSSMLVPIKPISELSHFGKKCYAFYWLFCHFLKLFTIVVPRVYKLSNLHLCMSFNSVYLKKTRRALSKVYISARAQQSPLIPIKQMPAKTYSVLQGITRP